MANNFEYKIHVSIDQDSVKGDVASILKKMKAEIENNAYKVELTGDPKQLIKDLANLKKMIPSLDLSEGLQFHLADILKDNTEEGKKIIDQFATYIINSVNETVSSIDSISEAIKKTQSELNNLYSRKKSLLKDDGTLDVVTAYENAQKKLQEASNKYADSKQKGKKEVYAQEMRDAYQDVLNFETEAQKAGAKVLESTETIRKGFSDIFKGMTANGSYKQAIAEVEKNIYTLENKLTGLKKDLESAQNPELKVKGKLADNFLSDLQSQLDSLTGLEVKVKPVVDGNVELEVEADIKPSTQSINESKQLIKETTKESSEQIAFNDVDLSSLESVTNKISEYKSKADSIADSAQETIDKLNNITGKSYTLERNMFDIPSTIREWNKPSLSANEFKKEIKSSLEIGNKSHAAVLYDNLKTFYPKSKATLKTFKDSDFEENYDRYLKQGNNIVTSLLTDSNLQTYRGYEETIHKLQIEENGLKLEIKNANTELENQKKVASELSKIDISSEDSRNAALQSIEKQISEKESEMQKMLDTDTNFQKEYHELAKQHINQENTQKYKDLLEKYNIPEGNGLLGSLKYLAGQRTELADSIDTLKDMRDTIISIDDASKSTDKTKNILNQSGFKEAAQSATEAKEAVQEVNDTVASSPTLYEESSGQLSLFEEEIEVKKKDAEVTNELSEANQKLSDTPGQMSISDYLEQAQVQAESTAESLDKIDQEINDDINNTGLDSLEDNLRDVGDTADNSTQEVNELKEALEELNVENFGALDIDRTTSYGVNKDGEEVETSTYKVKGENVSGVLDEDMNVISMTTKVVKGYSEAQAEAAEKARQAAQAEKELEQERTAQINKFKAFEAEQKKYEASMSKDAVQKYKEQYSELTQKVKEYVELRKEAAKSGKLDSEVPEIQKLDNEIVQMADDLEKNPLFNQAFEDKALSGLNNIEAKVQSIRFDKIISNYKELASLQSERYSLTNKGVSEDSEYITYLDSRISKINEENQSLQSLNYTEEQFNAIQEASANVMQGVNKQMNVNDASGKKLEQTIENTRASLQKQAASLTSNGKLMKVYGDQVTALLEEIKSPDTTLERLNQIRNELNRISSEAILAGQSGKTLFQVLKQRAQSLVAYLSTFASFYRVASYIRTAFETIKDLDTQLVDLRKTTTMTTGELNEFYNSSSDVAKQLGVTTSEIISQASAWSRLGYSSKEAATTMAELSSQFASVSPGMTTENATDYLVSTMQAYGITVDEVERKVMDNVNRIGNTFATTNAEIGEMLTRSSAAMKAANNTIEETIALESAAVQITRNAETTGTAFRTISMRIRGKQSLPPYSENYMLCA